jgi:hypothetical protein
MPASLKIQSWMFPFTHWNWKVAITTASLRGLVCMLALHHADLHARRHFGAVEAIYVLFTSGFFSALQQQALAMRPRMLAWLITVIAVPLTSLGADSLVHLWLNPVDAHALGIGALLFTLISAMFHWHMMQNGVMLVGKDSNSLTADLKQLPKVALSFLVVPRLSRDAAKTVEIAEESELQLIATEP